MTLPSSGTISWAMIRDEFGGSNPVAISQYYRGGSLVPNIPANSGVPTSGEIEARDFYGAMRPPVNIVDHSFTANSTLRYSPGTDGILRLIVNGGSTEQPGEWRLTGVSSDYEVKWDWITNATIMASLTGAGTTPAVNSGVWAGLGSARYIQATRGSNNQSGILRVQIRRASNGEVLDTADITFNLFA